MPAGREDRRQLAAGSPGPPNRLPRTRRCPRKVSYAKQVEAGQQLSDRERKIARHGGLCFGFVELATDQQARAVTQAIPDPPSRRSNLQGWNASTRVPLTEPSLIGWTACDFTPRQPNG